MISLLDYEAAFKHFVEHEMSVDSAHDVSHVLRVVNTAKRLCKKENASMDVVLPAAWLHDCVALTKNHPDKHLSSMQAADKAIGFLTQLEYPKTYYPQIHHAIVAHSYSANVTAQSIEAKIVQDADRLDALGAIGIARCLLVSGGFKLPLYDISDPFCDKREPNDKLYTLDHFYQKLFRINDTLHTRSAKEEATQRLNFMQDFILQLKEEIR